MNEEITEIRKNQEIEGKEWRFKLEEVDREGSDRASKLSGTYLAL